MMLQPLIISFAENIRDPLHQLLWNMQLIVVDHSFYPVLTWCSPCPAVSSYTVPILSSSPRFSTPSQALGISILLSTSMRSAFLASTFKWERVVFVSLCLAHFTNILSSKLTYAARKAGFHPFYGCIIFHPVMDHIFFIPSSTVGHWLIL